MKKGLALLALALLPSLTMASVRAVPVAETKPASAKATNPESVKEIAKEAMELSWGDLTPEPDQKVVEDFQAGKMDRNAVLSYLDELGNTPVEKMNSTYGRMPGYLVPLNMDKDQKATELLLVPTLGACIHVPPPPPNQTIYIQFDKGIKVTEAGYTPYWVTGTMIVEKNSSEYTDTLYSINVESIEEYL
ncbi:MAG: DUF3299 domain-containing protein [Endozoicomonas sp.]